jgi:hypothetical protein
VPWGVIIQKLQISQKLVRIFKEKGCCSRIKNNGCCGKLTASPVIFGYIVSSEAYETLNLLIFDGKFASIITH